MSEGVAKDDRLVPFFLINGSAGRNPVAQHFVVMPYSLQFMAGIRTMNPIECERLWHKSNFIFLCNPEPHLPIAGAEIRLVKNSQLCKTFCPYQDCTGDSFIRINQAEQNITRFGFWKFKTKRLAFKRLALRIDKRPVCV